MSEHTVTATSPLGSGVYSLDAAVVRISDLTDIDPDAIRDSLLGGDILEVQGTEYALQPEHDHPFIPQSLDVCATCGSEHPDAETEQVLQDAATLAADLLDLHKRTGISLDNWDAARRFVEHHTGEQVVPNGV